MDDLKYKEYSKEETKIYNEALARIKSGLDNGLSLGEAVSAIEVKDEELKDFIIDDALKVMIAELHYGRGFSLQQAADMLKVPLKKIEAANAEMLEDVGITAAEIFKDSNPGSPAGNA